MKKLFRTLCAVLSVAVLVTAVSCSGDERSTPKPVPVESISLSESNIYLQVGTEKTLSVTYSPLNATDKALNWSAKDLGSVTSEVATVDQNGKIRGLKAGTSIITVYLKSDNTISQTCRVTVLDSIKNAESVTVTDSKGNTSGSVDIKQYITLTAAVTPDDVSVKDVNWSCSDSSIASVEKLTEGVKVTGLKEGTAVIKAASSITPAVSGEYTVTVEPVTIYSITVSGAESNVIKGSSFQLTTTIVPEDATNKKLTWSSSDSSIASVSETGFVTAKTEGTATITAEAQDGSGKKGTITFTVVPVPVTGVSLDKTETSVNEGSTVQLTATIAPENAGNKNVSWSSSNNDVATVNNTGLVTAKAPGSVTITAKSEDGEKTASCTVTVIHVNVAVTGVSLNKSSATLKAGETEQLTATIAPANADNKGISWKSSNESIATVSTTGLVTAKAPGSATITATTSDGEKTASCNVTVNAAPVTSVTLKTAESVYVGSTVTLTPSILPESATDKSLTWKSSDESVATVDADGKVAGVKKGTSTITATSSNGCKGSCTLTVENIRVNGITINIDSDQTLYVDETIQINTTIVPANATDKSLTYYSSDNDVAVVSSTGLVTAKAEGSCTIRVSANDYENMGIGTGSKSFGITVKAKPYPVIDYSNGAPSINSSSKIIAAYPGYTGQLSASMSDSSSSTYTWSTSDSSIVDVDNTGKITFKGIQTRSYDSYVTATITCTAANGETDTLTCRSGIINEFVFSSSSWLNFNETHVLGINKTEGLNYYFYSATSGCTRIPGSSNITITSSDESVATVVYPHPTDSYATAQITTTGKVGSSVITATVGGYSKSFTLQTSDISKISLDLSSALLTVNQTKQLTATISPSTAQNKTVLWTSSNESVATVSSTGLVTAKGTGSATITAIPEADSTKKATCTVLIREKPFPVVDYDSLSGVNKNAAKNEIASFPGKSVVLPVVMNDGSASTFTFSSSSEYFEVTSDGTLTFKGNPDTSNNVDFCETGTITITSSLTGESTEIKVQSSFYGQFLYNNNWTNFGSTITISVGGKTDLHAMSRSGISSGGGTRINYEDYTVTSSDPSVASVSKGTYDYDARVTGVKAGKVTISFTVGNVTKFLYVEVTE